MLDQDIIQLLIGYIKELDASEKQKSRIVIDFRQLNDITIDEVPKYHLLYKLGRCQYFNIYDALEMYRCYNCNCGCKHDVKNCQS